MKEEQKDLCKSCKLNPYISRCLWKTKDVMTECEEFIQQIGSAY